jgi:transposase
MRRLSAKAKIREFLIDNVGRVVSSIEIRNAAGVDVSEWARRVRELREDEKWPILTHNDNAGLKPGQYFAYGASKAIDSEIRSFYFIKA